MYDLYPDWGPAKNRPSEPAMASASSTGAPTPPDLRDEGGQRPDDN